MKKIIIASIFAREILDSRGNPTIETEVVLRGGKKAWAGVPSGASTGSHEAHELRDKDKNRYHGMGVKKAVQSVNNNISPALRKKKFSSIKEIDNAMIALDGTKNKSSLGANAILSVSMACCRAFALEEKIPLYRYIRKSLFPEITKKTLPKCMMNVINGGVHAGWSADFQEYMIIPQMKSASKQIQCGSEIFHELQRVLHKNGHATTVGDEGGFAPRVGNNEVPLKLISLAVQKTKYRLGKDVRFGLDIAANEFYKHGFYYLNRGGKKMSSKELVNIYSEIIAKHPIATLEDPFAEDDWNAWTTATRKFGKKITVIGDDLFVTNPQRLLRGIDSRAANAILIKLNQIGSVSETASAILLAKKHSYKTIISHRSGETTDDFISDLAVACGADYLKAGSLSRGERITKYNRLMEIENELQQ